MLPLDTMNQFWPAAERGKLFHFYRYAEVYLHLQKSLSVPFAERAIRSISFCRRLSGSLPHHRPIDTGTKRISDWSQDSSEIQDY